MTKREKTLIIALIVVSFIALWMIGFVAADRMLDFTTSRSVLASYQIMQECIKADKDFSAAYGEVASISEYRSDFFIDVGDRAYYAICTIETIDGKSYLAFIDYSYNSGEDIVRFIHVEEIPE